MLAHVDAALIGERGDRAEMPQGLPHPGYSELSRGPLASTLAKHSKPFVGARSKHCQGTLNTPYTPELQSD